MQEARDTQDLGEKVRRLEVEIEKYKRIIVMQQECLFNQSKLETFQKCCHCDKVFVNESFLRAHLRRKHGTDTPESGLPERPRMVEQETQTSGKIISNEAMLLSESESVLGASKFKSWPDLRIDSRDRKSEWVGDEVEEEKKSRKSLKGKVFAFTKKLNKNLKRMSKRK